jgi:hypothetical protein
MRVHHQLREARYEPTLYTSHTTTRQRKEQKTTYCRNRRDKNSLPLLQLIKLTPQRWNNMTAVSVTDIPLKTICTTNKSTIISRKVLIGFFNWHNTSSRTTVLGFAQPLTEMNTTILPGVRLTPHRHLCADSPEKAASSMSTTLQASTDRYRNTFTEFYVIHNSRILYVVLSKSCWNLNFARMVMSTSKYR